MKCVACEYESDDESKFECHELWPDIWRRFCNMCVAVLELSAGK